MFHQVSSCMYSQAIRFYYMYTCTLAPLQKSKNKYYCHSWGRRDDLSGFHFSPMVVRRKSGASGEQTLRKLCN